MSRAQGPSTVKRKRPESNSTSQGLAEDEQKLMDLIRSKGDVGIWTADIKNKMFLPTNRLNKALKLLQNKQLIKYVVNIHNKGKKHVMAIEFEPSQELSGGAWYVEGSFDAEFINVFKERCTKIIEEQKVASLEKIAESIRKSRIFKEECSMQQIKEIVNALVLDDEIVEEKSDGSEEFGGIPFGKVCYRRKRKGSFSGESKRMALASIPCGACPRINQCTPDGIISPKTCVYYTKCSVFRELKKYQKDFYGWCGECQRERRERQIASTKQELLRREGKFP